MNDGTEKRLRLIGSVFLWALAAVGAAAIMLFVYLRTQLGF